MSKNVEGYEQREIEKNTNTNNIIIPDIFLEEFHNNITVERIKYLYNKLKIYELKGFVNYDKYIESMKETFDKVITERIYSLYKQNKIKNTYFRLRKNIEECLNEFYELYFIRFREVKCFIKNDKTVFYLTDYKPENYISSYNLICSLTVFLKSSFDNKIKLLFDLSDIDEDGFLNENEIRYMITTCNFIFCEESNRINTNSSILAQSLMNIRVNDILKQILYEPGNLYKILEEERYINFEILYNSLIKVKDYKYNILPSFINLKLCLKNIKREKTIKVDDKYKNDFITVSSALFTQKSFYVNKELYKNLSSPYLSNIIKPKKITEENIKFDKNSKNELPNINKNFFYKRKSILRHSLQNFNNKNKNIKLPQAPITNYSSTFTKALTGFRNISSRNIKAKKKNKLIIEKRKTMKDLLKETTIIELEEVKDDKNKAMKNFNKSTYYNKNTNEAKYIFEAYFDKIRNIEVKPGLIQFIGGNTEKEKEKEKENITGPQSSASGSTKNLNKVINNTNNNVNNVNNNINNVNNINKSKRKISEEKNTKKYSKMFSFSEKSLLGSNDLQNSVIKEEKSSEEKEDDNYKENKKPQKFKVVTNTQSRSNKMKHKDSRHLTNTIKRDNKKNLTSFKSVPNTENVVKNRNYSFHKRPSKFIKRKISIINPKIAVKIQKSIMDTNLKEVSRYKTMDEVFGEIKNQESKFNSDTLGGFGLGLVSETDKIFEEQNYLKKILGYGDKKIKPIFFGRSYLSRLSKSSSGKRIVLEKKPKA